MKKICSENQISAKIPGYIPEGFKADADYCDISNLSHSTMITFYFEKQDKKLNYSITQLHDNSDSFPIGIPTDHYEISEQKIADTTITVMKEDMQYTAIFIIDLTQYLLYTDHLDYDECQRILYSIFE